MLRSVMLAVVISGLLLGITGCAKSKSSHRSPKKVRTSAEWITYQNRLDRPLLKLVSDTAEREDKRKITWAFYVSRGYLRALRDGPDPLGLYRRILAEFQSKDWKVYVPAGLLLAELHTDETPRSDAEFNRMMRQKARQVLTESDLEYRCWFKAWAATKGKSQSDFVQKLNTLEEQELLEKERLEKKRHQNHRPAVEDSMAGFFYYPQPVSNLLTGSVFCAIIRHSG